MILNRSFLGGDRGASLEPVRPLIYADGGIRGFLEIFLKNIPLSNGISFGNFFCMVLARETIEQLIKREERR